MLIKMGGAGGGIDVGSKPVITFDGRWVTWHPELYGEELYWEAWFMSSGTLLMIGTYIVDAWGIGGGANNYNSDGPGASGYTNMVEGVTISGTLAVTIGAGGAGSSKQFGGDTSLGDVIVCKGGGMNTGNPTQWSTAGGNAGSITAGGAGVNGVPGEGYPTCRFRDPNKAGEGGHADQAKSGNGWLNMCGYKYDGAGFGAGNSIYSYPEGYGSGKSGALVIRIKM